MELGDLVLHLHYPNWGIGIIIEKGHYGAMVYWCTHETKTWTEYIELEVL